MPVLYLLAAFKIGYGPCYLQDSVIASGAEVHGVVDLFHKPFLSDAQLTELIDLRWPHVGIEAKRSASKSSFLNVPCFHDSFTDSAAGFVYRVITSKLGYIYLWSFNGYVYPVEDRT